MQVKIWWNISDFLINFGVSGIISLKILVVLEVWMKKVLCVVTLLVMVSVNIMTPFSYAFADEVVENYAENTQSDETSQDVSDDISDDEWDVQEDAEDSSAEASEWQDDAEDDDSMSSWTEWRILGDADENTEDSSVEASEWQDDAQEWDAEDSSAEASERQDDAKNDDSMSSWTEWRILGDTQDSSASASEWQTWEASEWQDEVDSGTGESTAIDTLKDIIESETENLSWDVEFLTWEILTGNIENLTWTALELATARETLNSDPIEKSETYNKVTVNVLAPVNTFPEGTKLLIEAIKWTQLEEVRQQISDEPTNNVDEDAEIVAFDIRFEYELSDGSRVELQPKENTVQVTFDYSNNKELKKADQDEKQEIEIYHINDKDENGEKVESWEEVVEKIEINEEKSEEVDNALVIDAESFSVYTIVVQRREEAQNLPLHRHGNMEKIILQSV